MKSRQPKYPAPVLYNVAEALSRWSIAGQGMVVAVSGGADSVALLRALAMCEDSVRPRPLIVAHLNHQLRGDESDGDEAFVHDLVAQLQASHGDLVEFCVERVDVGRLAAAEQINLENMARLVRYEWLVRVAREHNLHWVATGHTADDQAETVLHRLLRGSGIKGLRGIACRRELASGITLLRPLLAVSRDQVRSFLLSANQAFREDSSNRDPAFTRNRIRQQLLPQLARYNPRVHEVFAHLAEQADELFGLIETMARELLARAELPRAGGDIILDRHALSAAQPYVVSELLRLIWEREGWPQDRVGFGDWKRLTSLAKGAVAAIDFPGGLRAQLRERVVQIGPAS